MVKNTDIEFNIGTTNASATLGAEVWFNNLQIFNSEHITETVNVKHIFDDIEEKEHELRVVMKNKTPADTIIDPDGNILTDARLVISDVKTEGIVLQNILSKLITYTHNFNGSQPEIQDKFYGEMGCNGTVSLKFSTPIYLWISEVF